MQTQRMRAIETSERRMAALSASMDPCFIDKNVAVLHHTQFAYVEESTRTKVYDFATPKPRRFGEERVALNVAPLAMRGKEIMQEDAVMFMQIKEKEEEIGIRMKTVSFEEPDQELIEVGSKKLKQESLSGESDVEGSGYVNGQEQVDQVFSGEFG